MKFRFTISIFAFLFFIPCISSYSQTTNFNLSAYSQFLNSHQNISAQELMNMYTAGEFLKNIPAESSNSLYGDSVEIKYNLTEYEKELLKKNGFVVTERVFDSDIRKLFLNVWRKDLPVYISTDAILHAFHKSYDRILKETETVYIIPQLKNLLSSMHQNIPQLDQKYGSNPGLIQMLKDVDLYISVPRKILDASIQPYYIENDSQIESILSDINSYNAVEKPMFSTADRKIDYSQFKPRGHYTDSEELSDYFMAMMWLGRIELYLIQPKEYNLDPPAFEDIQRQVTDTYLIEEILNTPDVKRMYDEIEKVISSFVGEQDNVTVDQAEMIFESVNLTSAEQLLDSLKVVEFQDTLSTKPFSAQKILSQMLISDPFSAEQVQPASSFMLFGQRFVVDSYVTGNVVYDKILFEGTKITRMLPSTLDVLFAVGNSASAQLLIDELNQYHYSSNLVSLRYLIDSYGNDFWRNSIYNLWLNSIRSLNPPDDRTSLPMFMQTAAWWQQKMNGQLASWTELRHDNLLYAKQSYTAMTICSYPYGYVEPVPAFFESMKSLAQESIIKLSGLSLDVSGPVNYFQKFSEIMDTLISLSEKELSNQEFSNAEKLFLKNVLFEDAICGPYIDGWYFDLWYNDPGFNQYPLPVDYIAADFHTSPTDAFGSPVGWVKHSGTGPFNLMILNADLPVVGKTTFVGPVCSYYEYTTTNFLRLTDDEWKETYLKQSTRPGWVNIYLADSTGNSRGSGSQLMRIKFRLNISSLKIIRILLIPKLLLVLQFLQN